MFATTLAVLTLGSQGNAQTDRADTKPAGPAYTLHVYEDQLQVPTLVLNRKLATEEGLQPKQFSVSLDSGPTFHPLHVHVEGNDPLALGIVLDATAAVPPATMEAFEHALQTRSKALFTERDRISLYAVDCNLVGTARVEAGTSDVTSATALSQVLGNPDLHKAPQGAAGCDHSRRLWDAVAGAARRLSRLPGHRVLLILSDGTDYGSVNTWNRVREFAAAYGIALFGMRSSQLSDRDTLVRRLGLAGWSATGEDAFDLLCAGTGGITLPVSTASLGFALEHLMTLLRQRYILQFQRPQNAVEGRHEIDIRVPDRKAVVRPGGVLVMLPDPSLAQDPTTVPTDTSHAPVLGTRKTLPPPD